MTGWIVKTCRARGTATDFKTAVSPRKRKENQDQLNRLILSSCSTEIRSPTSRKPPTRVISDQGWPPTRRGAVFFPQEVRLTNGPDPETRTLSSASRSSRVPSAQRGVSYRRRTDKAQNADNRRPTKGRKTKGA